MRTSLRLSIFMISISAGALACSTERGGGGSGGGTVGSATSTGYTVSTVGSGGCDPSGSTTSGSSDQASVSVAATVTTGGGGDSNCGLLETQAGGVIAPASIASGANDIVYVATDDPNQLSDDTGKIIAVHLDDASATVLASGQIHPSAIAVDASFVYWTTRGGTVAKIPVQGGAITVLASDEPQPNAIALANGNVVWGNAGDGSVKSLPVDGGGETVLYAPGTGQITDLVVDANAAYFTDVTGDASGGVYRAPFAGDAPTLLAASPRAQSLAVDATHVYFLEASTSAGLGAVRSVGLGGGAVTTLVSNLGEGSELTVDEDNVYWAGQSFSSNGAVDHESAIFSVPKSGGGVDVIADDVLMFGHGLAPLQSGVIWADASTNVLERFVCN